MCPYCHGVAWVRPAQLAASNIRGEETQKHLRAARPDTHGELSGCILEESRTGLCLPGGARRHGQRRWCCWAACLAEAKWCIRQVRFTFFGVYAAPCDAIRRVSRHL